MALLVLFLIACAVVGWAIGQTKSRGGQGALLGCLLGPIGLLFCLTMGDQTPRCPTCREKVELGAVLCWHCRQPLTWAAPKAKP